MIIMIITIMPGASCEGIAIYIALASQPELRPRGACWPAVGAATVHAWHGECLQKVLIGLDQAQAESLGTSFREGLRLQAMA